MSYCSVAQVKAKNAKVVKDVSSGVITDAVILSLIDDGDTLIRADLLSVIDFDDMPDYDDDPATPDAINMLSKYKALENVMVYSYGAKRQVDEVNDVEYWGKKYTELLNAILSGAIRIAGYDNRVGLVTVIGNTPAFGLGEYGEYDEDLIS